MTPKVAVCTLVADRRLGEHSQAIPHKLDYPNMVYYVNAETNLLDTPGEILKLDEQVAEIYPENYYLDLWNVRSEWITFPKGDQDQARLVPICLGRNMCRMFAASQGAEWLLFLDSDVVVPPDSIQKLLEIAYDPETGEVIHRIVGGVVPGRGVHSNSTDLKTWISWARQQTAGGNILKQLPGYYVYWMQAPQKMALSGKVFDTAVVQHSTMGFVLTHRSVYERLGFTSIESDDLYTDPEGQTNVGLSEDPAFGIYSNAWMGVEWIIRLDLLAEHLGELRANETAQF